MKLIILTLNMKERYDIIQLIEQIHQSFNLSQADLCSMTRCTYQISNDEKEKKMIEREMAYRSVYLSTRPFRFSRIP